MHNSAVRKVHEMNPDIHAFYVGYEIFVMTLYIRHTTRAKPAHFVLIYLLFPKLGERNLFCQLQPVEDGVCVLKKHHKSYVSMATDLQ
jgi:hypothetical protein